MKNSGVPAKYLRQSDGPSCVMSWATSRMKPGTFSCTAVARWGVSDCVWAGAGCWEPHPATASKESRTEYSTMRMVGPFMGRNVPHEEDCRARHGGQA